MRNIDDQVQILVDPEWKNAFDTFVETGEGSQEFLIYFESDAGIQRAADIIALKQAREIRPIIEGLTAICHEDSVFIR